MTEKQIAQLREEIANMDCVVDFPQTIEEATDFSLICDRVEKGQIFKSDLRKIKDWKLYGWFVNKLKSIEVNSLELVKD